MADDTLTLVAQRQRTIDEFKARAVSVYGVHLDEMTTGELELMLSRLEWWGTVDEMLALHYLIEDRKAAAES